MKETINELLNGMDEFERKVNEQTEEIVNLINELKENIHDSVQALKGGK